MLQWFLLSLSAFLLPFLFLLPFSLSLSLPLLSLVLPSPLFLFSHSPSLFFLFPSFFLLSSYPTVYSSCLFLSSLPPSPYRYCCSSNVDMTGQGSSLPLGLASQRNQLHWTSQWGHGIHSTQVLRGFPSGKSCNPSQPLPVLSQPLPPFILLVNVCV